MAAVLFIVKFYLKIRKKFNCDEGSIGLEQQTFSQGNIGNKFLGIYPVYAFSQWFRGLQSSR